MAMAASGGTAETRVADEEMPRDGVADAGEPAGIECRPQPVGGERRREEHLTHAPADHVLAR